MRSFGLVGFFAVVALSTTAAADATATPAPAPAATASDAANDFGFGVYGALRGVRGNLFFSAPSLREALGIAYLGARGETAKEMSSVLRLDPDRSKSAADAKSELAAWQAARGSATLDIANRLWADQRFAMKPDFRTIALDAYGSPVDPVDFSHRPDDARTTINAWVEDKTHDRIKDLLPPPAVTPDTRLVITNAIWFKGTWARPFDKSATADGPFLADGRTSVATPMMHETGSFGFTTIDGGKMLEMPYGNSELAMDVVLPDSSSGLEALETRLSAGTFRTWTGQLSLQRVAVTFPKMTFTWGGSMKAPLEKLGMKQAFEESRADLTGIASPAAAAGNLYVSDVVHKAFVAVDEQGTEAAASTGVVVARETAVVVVPPPLVFKADHPFVFAIRDVKRGAILFMGRVTNPRG